METTLENEKDRILWKKAKKRVGFKNHLYSYLAVNIIFWAIWYFTGKESDRVYPWPLSVTGWWGFGLFWHFMGVYVFDSNKFGQVEKEYQKLKEKENNNEKM